VSCGARLVTPWRRVADVRKPIRGDIEMTEQTMPPIPRKPWMEPEIRELDVRETSLSPGLGNDVGGNPSPDCQRS